MKLRFFLALFAVSTQPLSASAAPKKSANRAARRSVVDYFRLLPQSYFGDKNRRTLLGKTAIIDIKRDYLKTQRTPADEEYPPFQMAIFRYQGHDAIAVSGVQQGDYFFDLLHYESGKWENVTEALSPPVDGDDLYFKLPQYGTTIPVFADDFLTAKLVWKKGVFTDVLASQSP